MFKFRDVWPTRNELNRALLTWQNKNKILPGSPAVAAARIAPIICQGQLPTMYSECSRFYSNLFTFGGVMAERVNTAKTRCKVNPIFGWSLASSRIMKMWSLAIISFENSACQTGITQDYLALYSNGCGGDRVFTGLCLSVCLSARYIKNRCIQVNQTWRINVPPWVLDPFILGSR